MTLLPAGSGTAGCVRWQASDDRVHRWRARRRATGPLVDRAPDGNPVHGILPGEVEAILAAAERWGPIDRSHRKLAHRGLYEGLVWVAPSTFRRVLADHGLVLPEPPASPRHVQRSPRRHRGIAAGNCAYIAQA